MERSGSPEGVVLADVGGTNVRFAVFRNGAVGPIAHMAVADYPQFADALGAFMAGQTDRGAIRHALFGVAGVVTRRALRTDQQSMDRGRRLSFAPASGFPTSISSTISKPWPGHCRIFRATTFGPSAEAGREKTRRWSCLVPARGSVSPPICLWSEAGLSCAAKAVMSHCRAARPARMRSSPSCGSGSVTSRPNAPSRGAAWKISITR